LLLLILLNCLQRQENQHCSKELERATERLYAMEPRPAIQDSASDRISHQNTDCIKDEDHPDPRSNEMYRSEILRRDWLETS
jgi:hypothetical protein